MGAQRGWGRSQAFQGSSPFSENPYYEKRGASSEGQMAASMGCGGLGEQWVGVAEESLCDLSTQEDHYRNRSRTDEHVVKESREGAKGKSVW